MGNSVKDTVKAIYLSRLALMVLCIGLAADLIPHPALGPSFIVEGITSLTQPVFAAD